MTTKGAAALTAMPAEDRATAPTALTHAVVLAAMPAEDKAAAPTVVGSSPVAAEMAAINPPAQQMVDLQKDAYQIAPLRHVRLNTTAVIAQELTSDLTERGIAETHLVEKVGQLRQQDTEPKQSMHIGRVQKPEQQVQPLTTRICQNCRESAILQGCINAIQSGTIAAPNLALTQLGQRPKMKQIVAEIDFFLWDINQALGTEEETKCNTTHAIGSGSMSFPLNLNIASLHRHLQKMAMECSWNCSGLCLLVMLLVVLRIVMQQSCQGSGVQVYANSGTHRLVEAVQTCYLALGQFE